MTLLISNASQPSDIYTDLDLDEEFTYPLDIVREGDLRQLHVTKNSIFRKAGVVVHPDHGRYHDLCKTPLPKVYHVDPLDQAHLRVLTHNGSYKEYRSDPCDPLTLLDLIQRWSQNHSIEDTFNELVDYFPSSIDREDIAWTHVGICAYIDNTLTTLRSMTLEAPK